MDTLIKADIFFFISSVATVILGILAAVLLYYLMKAGRSLYMILEMLKSGYSGSEEYVEELKERLEDNVIFRLIFPPLRKRRKPKTEKKEEEAKK